MEKDDRLPVGLFARRDIHIRHLQRLQVITEGKQLNRIGIFVLLKAIPRAGVSFAITAYLSQFSVRALGDRCSAT
jgi:hypothetical protein